jgi:hypothetical protein
VRKLRLFDMAVRRIHLGFRDIIPLLLPTPLRLLLAVLRREGRFDKPSDVLCMDRFYHNPLIGRQALEL